MHLVETVFTSVTDINNLDDLRGQPLIKHVTLAEFSLEVGTTSKHEARDVDLIIGDKMLNSMFSDLANVVVPFLVAQTRETQGRLSTTAVLLREINGELVDNLTCVSSERPEQSTVTIHDDKTEPGVRFQELRQGFGVEFVVTEVERSA